jgi:hypothetical protein
MADMRRTEVGFEGGQALVVRAAQEAYEALVKALRDDNADRWHTLEADESYIEIDLSKVVYVQREGGDHKVGF